MLTPAAIESRLQLHAPHDAAELWRASEWLHAQGRRQAIPPEQLDRLDLFLNEALANVMDHGGPSALAAPIDLGIRVGGLPGACEATLTIADGGSPFNPLDHTPRPAPQSLDDAVPGGLGIRMIRAVADDVTYAREDSRNHLACTVRWMSPDSTARAAADSCFVPAGQAQRGHGVGWMPLFRNVDEAAVTAILNQCGLLILSPGTPLLKPGEANDSVFILLSGNLSACLDSNLNPDAAIAITPGECIGEMSAIDGKAVTALVVATSEAHVVEVPLDLFFNGLLTIRGVARNLMIALTERMRRTNETMMAAQRKQLVLQHLHNELEVARELQAGMLPLRRPMFPERTDVDIAAIMAPASEVGGDFFDAFFVDDHRLFICIGDVSGHGIPAALFMARCIGLMRIAAMGTARPDELIAKINEQLCIGNDTNLFVTLFCGFLDLATGRLVYSNGGHCAPLMISGGRALGISLPKGTLVGALPGLRYTSLELTLSADDTLVCYTDGVTEAQRPSGEQYSEERLSALLLRESRDSPSAMLETVRRDLAAFTGGGGLQDDYTILAIRRCPAITKTTEEDEGNA